jgi:acetoin utilization protein AcuB
MTQVRELMTRYPITLGPHASVGHVRKEMRRFNIRHIPVVGEDGHLMGIVSDRDVARVRGTLFGAMAIGRMMTTYVHTVRPETDAFYRHNGTGLAPVRSAESLRLEAEELYRRVGHMHVVRRQFLADNGKLLGGRIGHVVLDQRAALGLQSEFDWQVAEALANDTRGGRATDAIRVGVSE